MQNKNYRKVQRKRKKKAKKPFKINLKFKKPNLDFQFIGSMLLWTVKITLVCILAFFTVWFFGKQVSVVGDSMQPALKNGDVVFVNRVIYNAVKPDRGEVIVFKPQGNENVHYYVKRVIGLPGETVEIKKNSIYIDGKKLEEDYVTTEIEDSGLAATEVTLAEDEYFVLGDDRKNSEDSRHEDVGNVKRRYIYGKAWFIKSGDNIGFVKG